MGIEDIPEKRLHIPIRKPEKIAKEKILEAVSFDSSWYPAFKEIPPRPQTNGTGIHKLDECSKQC